MNADPALAGNPNMKSRIFAHLIFRQSPASGQARGFGGFTIVDNQGYFPVSRGQRFEEGIPLKAFPTAFKNSCFWRTRRGAGGMGTQLLKRSRRPNSTPWVAAALESV
jgi:hypothetical protein